MLRKLEYFVHEKEVRAITFDEDTPIDEVERTRIGITAKVELEDLVETIVIQPTAPSWVVTVIRRVLEKYGFSFKVRQSALTVIEK